MVTVTIFHMRISMLMSPQSGMNFNLVTTLTISNLRIAQLMIFTENITDQKKTEVKFSFGRETRVVEVNVSPLCKLFTTVQHLSKTPMVVNSSL